jgi:SAM-dependent methyltransferase
MVERGGVSLFGYVHAIKLMLRDAKDVLIIGGGGGSLATMLVQRDHVVTVVDVDPAAEDLARDYFWLDPRVAWVIDDAFDFLKTNSTKFDAVVVDACDEGGLIPAFGTQEALLAIMATVRPTGSLILNLVSEDGAPNWGWDLARAMAQCGLGVTLFRPEDGWEGNELLHIRALRPVGALNVSDIHERPAEVRTYLMSLQSYPVIPRAGTNKMRRGAP